MPIGPFPNAGDLSAALVGLNDADLWTTYCFRLEDTGRIEGMASLMNVRPGEGVAEVGFVLNGPKLQRTTAASEGMYLLASYLFDELGYRRYEWKCDARNAASRRAALRYGFEHEGLFRQHMVSRGLNRDTTWFAMTDGDWPLRKRAFQSWLAADNMDQSGRALLSLEEIRENLSSS